MNTALQNAPVDSAPPDGGEVFFATLCILLVATCLCAAIVFACRERTAVPPLMVIGGAAAVLLEPVVGNLGHVWHPRVDQHVLFTALGVSLPWFFPMGYAAIFGGSTCSAFGITRRLCNLCNLTATCPELAPPGQHLSVAYAVPVPSMGDFDEESEIALAVQDLRDQYKNFDKIARILEVEVRRGDWPGQRSGHGYELPRETPIPNLWNVGDAVREFPNGGTEGCAETGKLVVEQILALHDRQPVSPVR